MNILKQSDLVTNDKGKLDLASIKKRDLCLRKGKIHFYISWIREYSFLATILIFYFSGVFPYEKVKSVPDLYAKSLPPKNEWYSSLTEKTISDEDLKFAEDFWKTFEWVFLDN